MHAFFLSLHFDFGPSSLTSPSSTCFTCTFPDLCNSSHLAELNLSNNLHSDPCSSTLPLLTQLFFLDLCFNSFSDNLPPAIFSLEVDVLFLNNNALDQPLLPSLGNTLVSYLTLANNGFTGSIPACLHNVSSTLLEVLLLNNGLSGCLPAEVGFLLRKTVLACGHE